MFCSPPSSGIFTTAYLTNPSEASFRTHLTELAFRRHLSRLYDADVDNDNQHTNYLESNNTGSGLHIAPKRHSLPTKHPSNTQLPICAPSQQQLALKPMIKLSNNGTTSNGSGISGRTEGLCASDGFHFANRATIGLRTPQHVFRSLGLCTIAAIPLVIDDASSVPVNSSSSSSKKPTPSDPESSSIGTDKDLNEEVTLAGKWFIGAFGKWWLGGTLQLRQQAMVAGANNANGSKMLEKGDRFSAGVLSFRALDLDPITEGMSIILHSTLKTFLVLKLLFITSFGSCVCCVGFLTDFEWLVIELRFFDAVILFSSTL